MNLQVYQNLVINISKHSTGGFEINSKYKYLYFLKSHRTIRKERMTVLANNNLYNNKQISVPW